jgi:Flp pilus assembly protein TadD
MKKNAFLALVCALLFLSGGCRPPIAAPALAAGIDAARADNWEEAIRHWQSVLVLEPGSAAAHNNLAVACEKKGAWEEARREYETALGLDPSNPAIKDNFERFKVRQEAARADKAAAGPGGRTR